MRKNIKRWLIVAAACVLTVGVLGWIKFSQISAAIAFGASFPEPSETVEAVSALEADYVPKARVVGEIVPVRSVLVSNELAGSIVEVGFEPGAVVETGQLLLQLDISEETAQLAAAKARVALAERTLERNERLVTQSAASQQAKDTALADRDIALADSNRIRAVMNKKTFRAPFDAHAGLERWEVGGYLPAATQVTTLVGMGPEVWVDFSLPQQDAAIELEAPVVLRTEGDRELMALVIARAPGVDRASRSVGYRAVVEDAQLAAVPGAIVSVEVSIGTLQLALKVPAVAIRQDTFGDHVFSLVPAEEGADAPFRAVRRAVEVLRLEAETAYLRHGLEPGEQVVAEGAFKLRDGIMVKVRSAPDRGRENG